MEKPEENFKKGLTYIALSILAYGSMPILIRALNANKVPPMSQVALRYVFALTAAVIYFLAKKSRFKIERKFIWLLMVVSIVGYGFSNLAYTYANLNTEVSNALFIFFSFSIITPILAFILLKEKINKFNLIGLVIAFVGLGFLFKPNSFVTWKIGGLFAFAAAVLQSIYLVGRRALVKVSSELILVSSTFLGLVSVGLLAVIFEKGFYSQAGIGSLSAATWLLTGLFGTLNFLGWYFLARAFQLLKAGIGSLMMMWEPVLVAVLAFFVYGEIPTLFTLIGASLVTVSLFVVVIKGRS